MASRKRKKAPKRLQSDPRQLALFAVDAPAVPKVLKMRTPKPLRSCVPDRPAVLTPREAALYLNVSVSTLKNWRAKKIGPAWRMLGARLIAYRPADLERFLEESAARH